MAIQAQNTDINIVPGGIIPVVHVSQYDVGRVLTFKLFDEDSEASIASGTTAVIEGTKPDGHGFQYSALISGNILTVETTQQMTAVTGGIECKLKLTNGSQIIGTALFILDVEKAGINDDTIISDTELPLIITLATEQMERAEAAASNAAISETNAANSKIISGSFMRMAGNYAASAENNAIICASILPIAQGYKESAENSAIISGSAMRIAGNYAEESEAHAVGKRNGVDVPSTDPTYHNNSKYWAEYASQYAQGGLIYKGSILFANIPISGMVSGDMYNIENDFTTDSRFQEGAGKKVKAGTNIAWNGTKWDVLAMGSDGHTIVDSENTVMPQRSKLKFVNCEITDDSTNDTTIIEAEGGGGGTAVSWEEQNVLGAKNLIPYPYVIGSVVYDSVTYTDLGDGRIQLNGTNSSTSAGTSVDFTDFFTLKAGTYILSTVTATGVNYNLYLLDGSVTIADTLHDENVIFTITNDVNVKMGIWITAGNINSNVIVYPMLRYASIEDSTWVPYAMTNRELTEKKINLSDLKTVVSSSSDFAAFKTAIANL